MAKKVDPDVVALIRAESEQTKDEPYPPGARFTRPNRDPLAGVFGAVESGRVRRRAAVADAAHLPPLTLVRSWILARLDKEQSGS